MDNSGVELERIRDILKFHQKGLTIAEIAKKLNLNRISTSKYLNMLVASGQAEMRIHGPSKVYYPCRRVPISTLLNFSTSLLVVMDSNLTILDVNDAVLIFFASEKKEIIGHGIEYSPIATYIDPAIITHIRNALDSQGSTLQTKWVKEGQEFHFKLKFVPTVFETGEHGATLIAEDITELSQYQQHLEHLVEERSQELSLANSNLRREIEEHKKARELLTISEAKYRELVENANSIILKLDNKGSIIFFNEFAQHFFGFSEQEIIGRNVVDTIVPEEDSEGKNLRHIIDELLRFPEKQVPNINENVRKNGERVWIEWTNKVIQDSQGRVTGMLSIGNDVTERKHAEDQLKFQNVLLKNQQEATLDGILVVDDHGVILSYNKRFIELWEIPLEILDKKDTNLALEDVQEKVTDPDEFIKKVRYIHDHTQKIIHSEIHLKDGRFFDQYSVPMVGMEGRYYGRVWYFRDVTDQKMAQQKIRQSEEKLSRIIDFLPDATFVINTRGDVIAWNHAMENLTGVNSRDILGKGDNEYSIALYGRKVPVLIDFAVQHGQEIPEKYSYCRRDGDRYVAETYAPHLGPGGLYLWGIASPLYDSAGNLIGAIESIRDITEIKRTEQALRKIHE
jgi:PAS domain S-box-containing protein